MDVHRRSGCRPAAPTATADTQARAMSRITPLGVFHLTVFFCVCQLASTQLTWQNTFSTPTGPGVRFHQGCIAINYSLFSFGGETVDVQAGEELIDYSASSTLWKYELLDKRWRSIHVDGEVPEPRLRLNAVKMDNFMVIFGGCNNSNVWLFDTNEHQWTRYASNVAPPPRSDASAVALDNNRMVVFGGCSTAGTMRPPFGCEHPLSDLWIWYRKSNTWLELPATNPIRGRFAHRSFHLEGELCLFGGILAQSIFAAGVSNNNVSLWCFKTSTVPDEAPSDGKLGDITWVPVPQETRGPRMLAWSVVTTDPEKSSAYILTGRTSAQTAPVSEVHVFDAVSKTWRNADAGRIYSSIERRYAGCGAMVRSHRNEPEDHIALFGGAAPSHFFGDVWIFTTVGFAWTESNAQKWPSSRYLTGGALVGNEYYIYGGFSIAESAGLSQVWRYSPDNSWTLVPRHDRSLVQDVPKSFAHECLELHGYMYCFGGVKAFPEHGLNNDMLAFDFTDSGTFRFHHVQPTSQSLPSRRNKMAFVKINDEAYIFGGSDETVALNDLWVAEFPEDLQVTYHFLGNGTTHKNWPPPRNDMIAFNLDNDLYIYGGSSPGFSAPTLGDFWQYSTRNTSWTLLADEAPPGKRFFAAVAQLSVHKVVMFGGIFALNEAPLSDLWTITRDRSTGVVHWNLLKSRGATGRWGGLATVFSRASVNGSRPVLTLLTGQVTRTAQSAINLQTQLLPQTSLECNPGFSSSAFVTDPCEPCAVGSFRRTSDSLCLPCPGSSWTEGKGSSSPDDCNICEPGSCSGHGTCNLGFAKEAACDCNVGFAGEACETNRGLTILLSTLFAILIVTIALLVYKRQKSRVKSIRLQSELFEGLLSQTSMELQELERTFEIDNADLTFKDKIGQGGFGEVWSGIWQDRHVAIKLLRESMLSLDEEAVRNFQAETKLIRSLRHRNVVLFWGAGVRGTQPYLVTEYMALGSLSQVLLDKSLELSWELRVRMASDAGEGLRFLHDDQDPPFLHRDVKSDNFLVSDAWVVKIADFGTARLFGSLQQVQQPSYAFGEADRNMTSDVGTLCWSAPEILSGRTYGLSADIYSFGLVLWEVLTRSIPYQDISTVFEIREQVLAGKRPAIPEQLPPIGIGMSDIIRKCWDADPVVRPPIADVVAALRELLLLER